MKHNRAGGSRRQAKVSASELMKNVAPARQLAEDVQPALQGRVVDGVGDAEMACRGG